MKRKSFTLLEVLVSAMIVAIVFAGIVGTIVAARRYILHATHRLTAVNLGRRTLENLTNAVRQDTWNSGLLALGAHNDIFGAGGVFIDRDSYGASYTVNEVDTDGDAVTDSQFRQVTINLTYPPR